VIPPANNGTPNFRQIRSFLALAKHLSFTRAAEELHISQPTLTVQIHQLEEMLSVVLFDRNRRQVRLTAAGESLIQPLEQLLIDLEAVMSLSSNHASLKSGNIRVAALPSIAASLLPAAIRIFKKDYPGISVHVHDVVAENIVALVKAEQVDFGIGMRLTPDKDTKVDDFITDRLCVFFPVGHPLEAKKPHITLKDCAQYPLILTGRNSSVRNLLERSLMEEHLEIQVANESNYISTALGMARAGLGITILPASAVDNGCMTNLDFAEIVSPQLPRQIGIISRTSRNLSPAAKSFIATLRLTAGTHDRFREIAFASVCAVSN